MRLDPLGQKLGQRVDKLALLLTRHRLRGARQQAKRRLLSAWLDRASASRDACHCLRVSCRQL